MRVLLDECVPARLRDSLPGHAVQTVSERGWRSASDQALLSLAEASFDVFLTIDRRLPVENDLTQYRLGFVIVRVSSNRLEAFTPVLDELRQALEQSRAGEVIYVPSQT